MQILVSDTSVLVDLERGNLLDKVFGLSWEFAVPDVLYRRELRDHGGPRLLALGLRVEELDDNGVALALRYRAIQPSLSFPDALALALAKLSGFVLLTGDGSLRELANTERVVCHGVLWVLDQLNDEGVTSLNELQDALSAIAQHPRCRLPTRQVKLRLERYRRGAAGSVEEH